MLYYTRKPGKVKPQKADFSAKPTIFPKGANTMKEKTAAALHVVCNLTAENLGFVIVWAVSLAAILRLACA